MADDDKSGSCPSDFDENEEDFEDEENLEGEEDFEEEELAPKIKKKKQKKRVINEFIDNEAELSGDDEVSDDELEASDDDEHFDPELVDDEAKDLDSEAEEEVRRLYHRQIESEDRRAVLLLQEQLEDNEVDIGQRRRKKFKWQTKEIMENSLKRHYDPDDDDSQEGDEDDDDIDYSDLNPRLKRPIAAEPIAGTSGLTDESNSNTMTSRLTAPRNTTTAAGSDINRFLFRDKEIVQALSTKATTIITREEKDRNIQLEIKRVLQSKSIFDQLYS